MQHVQLELGGEGIADAEVPVQALSEWTRIWPLGQR